MCVYSARACGISAALAKQLGTASGPLRHATSACAWGGGPLTRCPSALTLQSSSSHNAAEASKAATAMALSTVGAPPTQTLVFQMPEAVAPEAGARAERACARLQGAC